MDNRTRLNILLLVAVTALFYILLATGPPEIVHEQIFVTDIDPTSVQRIQVSRLNRPDIKFIRAASGWQITNPIHIPADPVRINAVLHLLHEPSQAQLDAGLTDISRFGLDFPAVTLVFNDNLYPQLMQPAVFFAGRRILPDDTLLQEVRANGFKPDNLTGFADVWQQLEASAISTSTAGLDRPLGNIMLQTRQGETIVLLVGIEGDELILARTEPAIAYRFPLEAAAKLGINLAETQ